MLAAGDVAAGDGNSFPQLGGLGFNPLQAFQSFDTIMGRVCGNPPKPPRERATERKLEQSIAETAHYKRKYEEEREEKERLQRVADEVQYNDADNDAELQKAAELLAGAYLRHPDDCEETLHSLDDPPARSPAKKAKSRAKGQAATSGQAATYHGVLSGGDHRYVEVPKTFIELSFLVDDARPIMGVGAFRFASPEDKQAFWTAFEDTAHKSMQKGTSILHALGYEQHKSDHDGLAYRWFPHKQLLDPYWSSLAARRGAEVRIAPEAKAIIKDQLAGLRLHTPFAISAYAPNEVPEFTRIDAASSADCVAQLGKFQPPDFPPLQWNPSARACMTALSTLLRRFRSDNKINAVLPFEPVKKPSFRDFMSFGDSQ